MGTEALWEGWLGVAFFCFRCSGHYLGTHTSIIASFTSPEDRASNVEDIIALFPDPW